MFIYNREKDTLKCPMNETTSSYTLDSKGINSKVLEVDSALSLRHCRDCHLKKESYKVLCIMSLSKVNKYFFYTIDSNNQTSFLGRFEKKRTLIN